MHRKRKLVRIAAVSGLTLVMTTGIALASMSTGTVMANQTTTSVSGSRAVSLLEELDSWYKVSYGEQTGYLSADWLGVSQLGSQTTGGQGTITADTLPVHSGPGAVYTCVGSLPKDTAVVLLEEQDNGWYLVSGGGYTGYVPVQGVEVTHPIPTAQVAAASVEADQKAEDTQADAAKAAKAAPAEPAPAEAEAQASQSQPTNTVNTDCLNVRAGAGTSHSHLGYLYSGDTVSILKDCGNGWYQISYGDGVGYVNARYIGDGSGAVEETTGYVLSTLNVRSGAGTSHSRLGMLEVGQSVTLLGDAANGWYKISYDNGVGYVSAQYISTDINDVPSTTPANTGSQSTGNTGNQSAGNTTAANTNTGSQNNAAPSSVGAQAVALAKQQLGKPYVYGAAGPNGFDCSGLFYYIFNQLGVSIDRGSSSQYYNSGRFVSVDEMQPGDLVYIFDPRFDSSGGTLPTTHVMMYVGNNTVLHASTTSYTVQCDTLFGGYYGNYVVAVKRMG